MMEDLVNNVALLGGSTALAFGAIPALVRSVSRFRGATKFHRLEICVDGKPFVIDAEAVDAAQLREIEAALTQSQN
jgi:hypothetical protein